MTAYSACHVVCWQQTQENNNMTTGQQDKLLNKQQDNRAGLEATPKPLKVVLKTVRPSTANPYKQGPGAAICCDVGW
jgi:hypothetical protein